MYSDSPEPRDMKNISVISAGHAADHTMIGMLNFSWYDIKRKKCRLKQAGRGGIVITSYSIHYTKLYEETKTIFK